MSMISESEKIAVCAVLGVVEVINGDFLKILSEHPRNVQERIITARDDIDQLVDAHKTKANETAEKLQEAEFEITDLKYQIKELIYRIEDKRGDVRNDVIYKDLKNAVNVA